MGPGHDPQVAAHDDLAFETEDMRARMSIALEDDLQDHPDMTTFLQPSKLSIETSTSPKPYIVPGNALQLIDDDPDASRSHTPSSVIIIDDESHPPNGHGHGNGHHEASTESGNDPEHERPIPRVRFRSRVRITSGLRRSKHGAHLTSTSTPSSSASGSPSSSISAPLRWQADENATWGPIGRRLSAYAHSNGWQKRPRVKQERQQQSQQGEGPKLKADERTPLLRASRPVAYVDAGLDGGLVADDERPAMLEGENYDSEIEEDDAALQAAALKREEEAVFGKWPWRIFNRHVSFSCQAIFASVIR